MKIKTRLRLLAVLTTVVAGAAAVGLDFYRTGTPQAIPLAPAPVAALAATAAGVDTLAATIDADQTSLRTTPGDSALWASLGSAYVEEGRATANPDYYPKADGALQKSLALKPQDNLDAMIGSGMLANSRHDFAKARDWATRALDFASANATAVGVLVDADTQLGDYPAASAEAQRMLDLRPGVAAFTRASYEEEQHGRDGLARQALQRALGDAASPADVAFCHHYLGELAFNSGVPSGALDEYRLALRADPTYTPALAGTAKAEAALGDTAAALRDYDTATSRLPSPQYVLEYAELLESQGSLPQAHAEYDLLGAEEKVLAANGVIDDLMSAQVAADHGDALDAVRHARAEWSRRHSVLVADALAWALHRAGRDAEAIPYAQQANAIGWHNATFEYHVGAIEAALGQPDRARTDLTAALATNPHFSLQQAPAARRILDGLGGAA